MAVAEAAPAAAADVAAALADDDVVTAAAGSKVAAAAACRLRAMPLARVLVVAACLRAAAAVEAPVPQAEAQPRRRL